MIKPRLSRPPSPYNVFLFHAVRAFQAVAAAIVLAVMSFSVHWLIADGYPVPWTFLVVRRPESPIPWSLKARPRRKCYQG